MGERPLYSARPSSHRCPRCSPVTTSRTRRAQPMWQMGNAPFTHRALCHLDRRRGSLRLRRSGEMTRIGVCGRALRLLPQVAAFNRALGSRKDGTISAPVAVATACCSPPRERWESCANTTEAPAGATQSVEYEPRIKIDSVFLQKREIFLLKAHLAVMFLL